MESKRFSVMHAIGKGSYGVVCLSRDNMTGQPVAIKRIHNVFENVADAHRILREITLLRLLKHPDVVEIKHVMLPSDPNRFKDLYVVFELMETDLHQVIGANDDLTRDHHKVFLYQLLRGLNFLHTNNVLHRDLKPKNILANSNCKLKICDFGLARPCMDRGASSQSPVMWTDYVATRWYRAPELCGCFYGNYNGAVDMWSIGCIFAEILQGKPLFPGKDAAGQLQLVTDLLGKPSPAVINNVTNAKARKWLQDLPEKRPKNLATVFPKADPRALDLLSRMLALDPKDRPTPAAALEHPYFAELPSAVQQDRVPVPENFGFEHSERLTEQQVRHLIFKEVLNYHPTVKAAYEARQEQIRRRHMEALAAAANGLNIGLGDPLPDESLARINNPLDAYDLAMGSATADSVDLQFLFQAQVGSQGCGIGSQDSAGSVNSDGNSGLPGTHGLRQPPPGYAAAAAAAAAGQPPPPGYGSAQKPQNSNNGGGAGGSGGTGAACYGLAAAGYAPPPSAYAIQQSGYSAAAAAAAAAYGAAAAGYGAPPHAMLGMGYYPPPPQAMAQPGSRSPMDPPPPQYVDAWQYTQLPQVQQSPRQQLQQRGGAMPPPPAGGYYSPQQASQLPPPPSAQQQLLAQLQQQQQQAQILLHQQLHHQQMMQQQQHLQARLLQQQASGSTPRYDPVLANFQSNGPACYAPP
ncbi:hypothetical protein GPECTOR_1g406 [Gonium pectorale]|uniref:Protein kinase domain-containing protein n=1 Tax=Gonium pectorale TaxID=33097 RepID=A0A150H349_GONPE|nr:hypothetical protein GPECTOR_1g406 [Gonium pectorale]|eukprot:KXZ56454.1 hypothetical protein GPECTOR_1g406 [Gonium pectorale]